MYVTSRQITLTPNKVPLAYFPKRGGQIHMLMTIHLVFLTATWSGATATASWGVESRQRPPPGKDAKAALSSRFGRLLGHVR